jgi:hypothetical protein
MEDLHSADQILMLCIISFNIRVNSAVIKLKGKKII